MLSVHFCAGYNVVFVVSVSGDFLAAVGVFIRDELAQCSL